MVPRSDEVNRFVYVPKDWVDDLNSRHNRFEYVQAHFIRADDYFQPVQVWRDNNRQYVVV